MPNVWTRYDLASRDRFRVGRGGIKHIVKTPKPVHYVRVARER